MKYITANASVAIALFSLAFVAVEQANAGGINILNPLFGGWLIGGEPERHVTTRVAGIAPNSGVAVNGVRCNYGYVVRGGEKIRQEICESTR